MNKKLKIAVAAVSVVMAGTMAFGMFGCSSKKKGPSIEKEDVSGNLNIVDGKLTWAANTEINLNVGDGPQAKQRSITYTADDISGTEYMPDGKSYKAGDLKPAWAALQTQLSTTSAVKLVNKYQNLSSNNQISTPITQNELSNYDIITGSLEEINKNSGSFLNFTNYLDYMPNYKAFLEANPVTRYSLTGDYKGGMYAAPYYDGNDDIEKYSMMNYNWVKHILDQDVSGLTGTFKAQADAKKAKSAEDYGAIVSTAPSVTAYMGTTGSYEVDTTDPAGTANAQGVIPTIKLKVNYDKAQSEATTAGKALYEAIKTAAGDKAYTGTSGNIVDLQNWAIQESAGEVTGAQLANILREYIKVAYQKASDSSAFYTRLSDVFCSASAGWDVDLLVGISRVVVTATGLNQAQNAGDVYAIAGRETTTQRRVDLVALAGELYGVRGLESRYEYTYFNSKGEIQDARTSADSYDTLTKFSNLTKEGLVNVGNSEMTKKYDQQKEADLVKSKADGGKYGYTKKEDGCYYDGDVKKADEEGFILDSKGERAWSWNKGSVKTTKSGSQTFMLHDYVQTQTSSGLTGDLAGKLDQYNFAPVVNAISKWDTDGDGTRETTMRFTESWRSVKNTGFCIPKSIESNKDKLSAVLALVDYLFSTDGQLLMSYGPQSTNGNENPNGWWYATEVSDKTADQVGTKIADATNYAPAQYAMKAEYKNSYFIYNEKVYTGTAYNGTQVPTITDDNNDFYLGKSISVGGKTIAQGKDNILMSNKGSYTNYARYTIGSTLPIGNKNQGFEYQATARCGIDGAAIVTKALLNGTLKHVKLTLDKDESPWYLIAPTALPMTQQEQETLKNSDQTKMSGTYFYNSSSTNQTTNIYIDLLYYGLGSSANICGQESLGKYSNYDTGAKLVKMLNDGKLNERIGVLENGWYAINSLYELGYKLK